MRIGLLGGSFNPAHDGHVHISELALKRLQLDRIWWLVSPQNPLKSSLGMAPLARRLEHACAVARHPRIDVTDIETKLGTRYTVDTLQALTRRRAGTQFVWLMGADSFAELHRWRQPDVIFHSVPLAVFARPGYNLKALHSRFAQRYRDFRLSPEDGAVLAGAGAPAWIFFPTTQSPLAATKLRERGESF